MIDEYALIPLSLGLLMIVAGFQELSKQGVERRSSRLPFFFLSAVSYFGAMAAGYLYGFLGNLYLVLFILATALSIPAFWFRQKT